MKQKRDENSTKFEFLLKLNDNIVCQRYFNVKGHNPKMINSMELYEEISSVSSDIQAQLVSKTHDYMAANISQFYAGREDEGEVGSEDFFTITILKDEKTLINRYFDAFIYPPKVRYTVDIRPSLRRILKGFTEVLSSKNPTTNYLTYDLK
jgi:hypothetical protein